MINYSPSFLEREETLLVLLKTAETHKLRLISLQIINKGIIAIKLSPFTKQIIWILTYSLLDSSIEVR